MIAAHSPYWFIWLLVLRSRAHNSISVFSYIILQIESALTKLRTHILQNWCVLWPSIDNNFILTKHFFHLFKHFLRKRRCWVFGIYSRPRYLKRKFHMQYHKLAVKSSNEISGKPDCSNVKIYLFCFAKIKQSEL